MRSVEEYRNAAQECQASRGIGESETALRLAKRRRGFGFHSRA
jgi:hypothetical protein